MVEKYLLAIDGGSSSVRAIIFNVKGEQLFVEQAKWSHLEDSNYPGSMSFDYDHNWELICQCIQAVIRNNQLNPADIHAIATTTMREGFILYDENKAELIGFANVDSRAVDESAYLKQNDPDLELDLFKLTGESFALGALPRLLWVQKHQPELMQKAKYLNMLNDWISFKLTGLLAAEPSNASTTGIFNLRTKKWEFAALEKFGIHLQEVPTIESGNYLGNVSQEAADQTGLSTETMVIMGGGDAQLGCIGIGVIDEGESALLGGSFWQFNHNILPNSTLSDTYPRVNCHAIPELWQLELIAWQVGFTIDWFIDAFFAEDIERLGDKTAVYQYMNDNIKDIPAGANGMFALFSNEMNIMNLKNAAPTFTNFQLDANLFNRFTFYQAIMEGIAFVLLEHKERIELQSRQPISSLVFAGGASNNQSWCQIIANVLGIPIKVPVIKEATAFGAAILAGIGSGLYSKDDISRLVQFETTYQPDMEIHKYYQARKEVWRQVYNAQMDLADQGLTTSMWRAPGI